jgi:hypothetical protein
MIFITEMFRDTEKKGPFGGKIWKRGTILQCVNTSWDVSMRIGFINHIIGLLLTW